MEKGFRLVGTYLGARGNYLSLFSFLEKKIMFLFFKCRKRVHLVVDLDPIGPTEITLSVYSVQAQEVAGK